MRAAVVAFGYEPAVQAAAGLDFRIAVFESNHHGFLQANTQGGILDRPLAFDPDIIYVPALQSGIYPTGTFKIELDSDGFSGEFRQ